MKQSIVFILCAFCMKVSFSQGCVAIRSNGNTCSINKSGDDKGWIINFNNRYFRSYKHFVSKVEQKHRVDSGTEVINYSYSLDITATKLLNRRWSLSLTVPVIFNERSSKYEHYGNASKYASARRSTYSTGIGDVRFMANYWLFTPSTFSKGNIQVGLGLKLPTGDFRYQDFFYRNDSTSVLGYVDQSIQLGDGGTGIPIEIKGYYNFTNALSVFGNAYYLINPREQNGTSTTRGGTASANSLKYFTSTMSVPDQYMLRAGVNYMCNDVNLSVAGRVEAIPSSDLIGGDKGFRRPGSVMSVEPAVSFKKNKLELYISLPIAVQRNRPQSYSDKLQTQATGIKTVGDAAFADYSINAGCSIHLN